MREDSHPSDQELLLAADGEPSARRVQEHLASCSTCQARQNVLSNSLTDFVRHHQQSLNPQLPPAAGARVLLKSRLAEASASHRNAWERWPSLTAAAGALAVLVMFALAYWLPKREASMQARVVFVPNPALTPGVATPVTKEQICAAEPAKNRGVPVSLRRRVFQEYGIGNAEPQAYEVDYLITPALGGADDIRNLWPQSYSSTVWNAQVKDALEDRLRDLVCDGRLDLANAQRDIAKDWIAAYKKYFQTDSPTSSIQ